MLAETFIASIKSVILAVWTNLIPRPVILKKERQQRLMVRIRAKTPQNPSISLPGGNPTTQECIRFHLKSSRPWISRLVPLGS